MSNLGKKFLAVFQGKRRWQWLFEKMHFICLYGMHIGGGSILSQSGERNVLETLMPRARGGTFIWVDAGAHDGGYSRMVQQIAERHGLRPQGFLCEPNETHRSALLQMAETTGCRYFPVALGSSPGMAEFYRMPTDTLSSLVNHAVLYTTEAAPTIAQVEVRTLDDLMMQEGVTQIDLLKIDVEGFEYEVLRGCQRLRESGSIRAIQFEFGRAQIISRCFLKDFFDMLGPQCTLHRVLKDGITPPLTYHSRMEIFQTTNFLALRRNGNFKYDGKITR